jgi:hypothetical protein
MQTTGNEQALTTDELFGVSKKFTRELEQLALHSHGAVLKQMQVAFEHRNLTMQREEVVRQQRMQEQQVENQRAAIDLQRRQFEAAEAQKMRDGITAVETTQ